MEAKGERRDGLLLLVSMVVTFVVLRAALYVAPDTDVDVGGYNVHHLFTGLLLTAAGGIPLAVRRAPGRWRVAALLVFGVGLSMALDEWVYLIATDGTNASYSLPVSFWGGLVVVGLACVYTAALARIGSR